jgi:hypothetical protein
MSCASASAVGTFDCCAEEPFASEVFVAYQFLTAPSLSLVNSLIASLRASLNAVSYPPQQENGQPNLLDYHWIGNPADAPATLNFAPTLVGVIGQISSSSGYVNFNSALLTLKKSIAIKGATTIACIRSYQRNPNNTFSNFVIGQETSTRFESLPPDNASISDADHAAILATGRFKGWVREHWFNGEFGVPGECNFAP